MSHLSEFDSVLSWSHDFSQPNDIDDLLLSLDLKNFTADLTHVRKISMLNYFVFGKQYSWHNTGGNNAQMKLVHDVIISDA